VEIFDRALKLSDNIGIEDDFVMKKRRSKKQNAHNTCYVIPKENLKIKIFEVTDTF